MNRLVLITAISLLALVEPLNAEETPASTGSCVKCHQSSAFFATYPKLHQYYRDWQASPHAQSRVTCDDCHGGDPSTDIADAAHLGVLHMTHEESTLFVENQPDTCGSCHRNQRRQFIESKHYQALMAHRTAPTCTTCHPAMNRRPQARSIVLNACRTCHTADNPDGLPLVADQAEETFRQIKVTTGFVGWARLHYASRDWPAGSRATINRFEATISGIVDRIHRFDLSRTESELLMLRARLDELFERASAEMDLN